MTRSTSEHLIPNVRWWALVSSALCPILLIAGWSIADAVQPGSYSPLRQTVSVLAGYGGTHRWIMTAAMFLIGSCHLITAAGLTCLRVSPRLMLALTGLAVLGVASFPEPAHGSTAQHLACTGIGAAAIAIWPAFVGVPHWRRSAVLSIWGTSAATVAFLGLLGWLIIETRNGAMLGLAERISLTMQTSWPFVVVLTARHAMRASRQASPPSSAKGWTLAA